MAAVLTIRRARDQDVGAVHRLLAAEGLPVEGIGTATDVLLVAVRGGRVVGSAAVELYGRQALLRSVVVAPSDRSTGVGERLVRAALHAAAVAGVVEVAPLTLDTAEYFERFGFRVVDRGDISGAILNSPEFTVLCPATAISMWLEL
jgi:amino-acid N-acetyltransferase